MRQLVYHKCRSVLYVLLLLISALRATAGQVQPSRLIISIGANAISMKPLKDSAINHLELNFPGLYVKFSVESYKSAKRFIHLDLNMSFNNGVIENGTMKESRLCFNYGFGRAYDMVKISISPGLCFSSVGYQNNLLNKSLTEVRFAPSLGMQVDLILLKSECRYLALFIEGSSMIAKSSRMVQQLTLGINYQPGFRKADRSAPKAY